jgi:hypothetical protein
VWHGPTEVGVAPTITCHSGPSLHQHERRS